MTEFIPAQQPNYYQPQQPAEKPGKGAAVTGLVLGILAVVFGWVPFLGLVLGAPGLIFGAVGRKHGMGIAGLVLGILGVVFGLIVLAFWGAVASSVCADPTITC